MHFYSEKHNSFISKQKECLWCKRIYKKDNVYVFCSKKCNNAYEIDRHQLFRHNNRCKKHKLQKLSFRNICWSCYKQSLFTNKTPRMKGKFLIRMNGFTIIPTFRTSKDSWNGDKTAFEQFLIDNRVKWFAYIKYYENKSGRIKPIVAGKSGSLLVNNSGSDLNFSTVLEHGASRQFMHFNKFDWHYDHIAIKKCKNEKDAYRIECKMIRRFELFES